MSKIKFHKANALPSPLTEADDGIWFIFQPGRTFKAFIISNGFIFPLNYDDATPDYSFLTNQRHIKKVGSDLADSNIQDTAVGSEVLGRLDSYATVERRTETSMSSLYTIDLSNPSGHYDLELSGNTSINFSNMIGENQSTVITLVVNGNFSLLFPSWLKPLPNNDAYYSFSRSDLNLITIIIRHGGSSPSGLYSLTNVDIS